MLRVINFMAAHSAALHGLLVVDKPGLAPGAPPPPADAPREQRLPTSHDVVQLVRRWSGERRIGHTGTLDPMASGVLVLCLGQATRLVEYYQGHNKQYYAEIQLGIATDTYDALGSPTANALVPPLNRAHIDAVLQKFRGSVLQSPPVYSALKQGGESVHRKARRGEAVSLDPRPVTFYTLDLLDVPAPDRLVLRLVCSAGAYVRSLAHDLGQALGTYGHLAGLRREAAGPFTLAHAHPLATIEHAVKHGELTDLLLPPGFGLEFPIRVFAPESIQRLGFGQQVPLAEPEAEFDGDLAQAYDEVGAFVGIVRRLAYREGMALWKAEKWFGG
jgi:tRNA pseudouridine55 synthase